MILADLALHIQIASKSIESRCTFNASLKSGEKLILKTELPNDFIAPEDDNAIVSLPGGAKVKCFFSRTNVFSNRESVEVELHPMRSPVMIDASRLVIRVHAAVYNFGDRGLFDVPHRRLVLRDNDWNLELIAISDYTVQFPPDLQNDTLRITHSLSINKEGGGTFTATEAQEKLAEVVRFLSFCHGQRVGYGYATGTDSDGVKTLDFLGTSHASPYNDGDSWLDRHKAKELPHLYSAFLSKIRSSSVWDEMFRTSEYWLGRANTNFTGPDGGMILTQAALERISWEVLTQPPFSLPIKDAEALHASGRLRKLLEEFHIPTSVPVALSELSALVSQKGWKDGPDAFVKIRNEMVHPRRKISAKIPYYECYVLGRWYADLCLLALLGYQGEYSNRTKIRRWVGETEPVPWL